MTAEVVTRVLKGGIDLHVHPAPSPLPRRIDAVEAAQAAEAIGMRAIVVKSHHHSTVTDVLALGRDLNGLPVRVYGGIALNSAVGGLNPHAVDLALKLGGRIVWFPTIGSPQHIAHHAAHPDLKFPKLAVHVREERPVDVLDESGQLRPEVHDIIGLDQGARRDPGVGSHGARPDPGGVRGRARGGRHASARQPPQLRRRGDARAGRVGSSSSAR